jgi:hypothetical protein
MVGKVREDSGGFIYARGAMADHPRWKVWGRWIGYALLALIAVAPWPLIAWGRAERSASAPAVLEDVYRQGNGRFTIGAYSFSVDGRTYRDQDAGPRAGRGERTWGSDDLAGMHVCYHPDRPGEDFALTPPHYQCGDPDIITSDGGW